MDRLIKLGKAILTNYGLLADRYFKEIESTYQEKEKTEL